jgi:hypothetical protein
MIGKPGLLLIAGLTVVGHAHAQFEGFGKDYHATGDLNIRKGPGTNHPVTGALSAGETITAVGKLQDGDWYLVGRNGVATGYEGRVGDTVSYRGEALAANNWRLEETAPAFGSSASRTSAAGSNSSRDVKRAYPEGTRRQVSSAEAPRTTHRRGTETQPAERTKQQQTARAEAAARGATVAASRSYDPYPDIESCGFSDVDCTVRTRCKARANRDEHPQCLETHLQRELKVRQKTLAASFDVEGEIVRLYLGRSPWTQGEPGDWCGPDLWGRIEYPQELNVIPALAKTTVDILNRSLSSRCPEAKHVQVFITTFSTRFSNRNTLTRTTSGFSNYITAFQDGDIWQFVLHEDYVKQLEAKARLSALWAMISNPTALGYVHGTIIANNAAAKSAQGRLAKYAREGKICELPEDARHCHVSTTWTTSYGGAGRTTIISHTPTRNSSCPAPCKFAQGYCNMKTGVVYGDIEVAERSNCRAATEAEMEEAIRNVQPSSDIKTYAAEILYTPWHELPHGWTDGLEF